MILAGGVEGILMDSCFVAVRIRVGFGGGAMTSVFMKCSFAVLQTRDYEVP